MNSNWREAAQKKVLDAVRAELDRLKRKYDVDMGHVYLGKTDSGPVLWVYAGSDYSTRKATIQVRSGSYADGIRTRSFPWEPSAPSKTVVNAPKYVKALLEVETKMYERRKEAKHEKAVFQERVRTAAAAFAAEGIRSRPDYDTGELRIKVDDYYVRVEPSGKVKVSVLDRTLSPIDAAKMCKRLMEALK